MQQRSGPLPLLVGGVVTVAVLATLLVNGGWLIWVPVLLALGIGAVVAVKLSRP